MTYLQNQLNVYDTYTYNISMFMIRPDSVSQMERNITTGNAILIVDNAREARYNISDMEQSFLVGHNKARNTYAHRFDLTIAEPNGVTLLDTIRRAATQLGIVNHQQALYLLRIEFNGRVSNGAVRKHPQVFYYPVIIRDFQFKVDDGGTLYHINCVENSTLAYNYLNNVIRNQITIEATTVGDFFTQFVEQMNRSAEDAITYSTDQLFPDTVQIEFDSEISNWEQWEFQALTEEETQNNINIISIGEGGERKLQITVNNGSNITDIVTTILALTAEYKNILLEGNDREFARERPNEDPRSSLDDLPVFHKVQSNLEYGEYDILRGEYQKNMIYRIRPFIIPDEALSPTTYVENINNVSVQRQRVEALRRNGLLRKKYDYIFTGKNTEIIEFDLKFDRAYFYLTPYGGGQLGDPNVVTPIQSQAPSSTLARLIEDATRQRKEISDLESQRRQAQRSIPVSIGGIGTSILDSIGIQINTARTNFRNSVSEYESLLRSEGFTPEQIAIQMRFAQDVINDDDAANSDNDNRGGMLRFGALQANIDNPADLASIELGVRGDPFWLGRPNSFYDTGLSNDPELADYEQGLNMFFLKVNLPNPFEDSQGRRKPSPDYEVSGLYTVRDVIARYTQGQFTMHLNAVRDILTNTPSAADALDREEGPTPNLSNSRTRQAGVDIAQTAEDAFRRITGSFRGGPF